MESQKEGVTRYATASSTQKLNYQFKLNNTVEEVFIHNCAACHAISMEIVGPALEDVPRKRDSLWLRQMIRDGSILIEQGDSIANRLFREYHKIHHPSFSDLSDSTIEELIEYINDESENKVIP